MSTLNEVVVIYTLLKVDDEGKPYPVTKVLKLDVEVSSHTLFSAIARIEGVVDVATPKEWKEGY